MTHQEVHISSADYFNIIQNSVQGIWIHIDFKPVFVNNSCLKIFGYEEADFLNLNSILQCTSAGEQERITSYKEARLSGKEAPVEYEFEGLHSNGSVIYLSKTVSVIDWGDKKAVLSILTNITKRKIAEEMVRESEKKILKVFETSPDIILFTRISDGVILDVNKNFENYFGHKKEEVLGKSAIEMNLWSRPEQREEIMAQIVDNGGIRYMNTQYRKKNNDLSQCYLSCEVVDISGESCLMTTIRDITDHVALVNTLRQSEESFSKVFQSSEHLMMIIRISDETVVKVNKAFENITGWQSKDVIGKIKHDMNLWTKNEYYEVMEQLLKNGSIKHKDISFMTKNNKKCYGELCVEIISIAEDPCMLSIVKDRTEQRLSEQEVKQEYKLIKTELNQLLEQAAGNTEIEKGINKLVAKLDCLSLS